MSDPAHEHELILRRDAAQAALDHWRTQPWRMGEADCARMAAAHLRRMGYTVKLPPARSYRTPKSALAKLDELGFPSVEAALDALGLERIAPAAAIAGDIVQLPADHESLAALTIALGNGRVLGWHESVPTGAEVLQPLQYLAAWRVPPTKTAIAHARARRARRARSGHRTRKARRS